MTGTGRSPAEGSPSLNWRDAYARLERVQRTLEAGAGESPDTIAHVLQARAAALAQPRAEPTPLTDGVELLVFTLGPEQYGIETASVGEVVPLRALTSLPDVPASVLGVVNHRGRMLAVLDLRPLVEQPADGIPGGSRLVVVDAGGLTVGLLAETVSGIVPVGLATLRAPALGPRQAFIRGVTPDLVAVLDVGGLARDPRVQINQQAG